MSRIVYANFGEGCDICCINNIFQWEELVSLRISGVKCVSGTEVYFSLDDIKGESVQTVCSFENNVLCTYIPAFILEKQNVQTSIYKAFGYIYYNEDGVERRKKIIFEIKARPKPSGYEAQHEPSFEDQVLDALKTKVEMPFDLKGSPNPGENGKVLTSNGMGGTKWEDPVIITDEQVDAAAERYLEDYLVKNPFGELTTTRNFFDSTSVTPTSMGNVIVEKMGGATHQKTYNGYQLFDASKMSSKTQGGATVTNNGDGSFTISGSGNLTEMFSVTYRYGAEEALELIKKVGTYRISAEPHTSPYLIWGVYNTADGSPKKYVSNAGGTSYINITEEDISMISSGANILRLYIYGINGTAIVGGTIKPMVYVDGDGTWEPFVGGQPSPNTDYNQHIDGVGDMGWFDGELLQGNYDANGVLSVTTYYVCSKNMIPCKQGDVVRIIYEEPSWRFFLFYYDKDEKFVSHFSNTSGLNYANFTIPSGVSYFKFSLCPYSDKTTSVAQAKHITVTINGKYAVIVDSSSGNLFNAYNNKPFGTGSVAVENEGEKITIKGQYYASFPVDLKANEQYYVSFKTESSTVNNAVCFEYADKTLTTVRTTSHSFKPSKDVTKAYLYSGTGTEGTTVYKDFQIEKGTEQTGFRAYNHKRTYIPLSAPLYEDDYIKMNDGKYEGPRGSKKIVFDGTEYWGKHENNSTFYSELPLVGHKFTKPYSTHYRGNNEWWSYVPNGCVTNNTTNGLSIAIRDDSFATVSEWKAFLAEQYANGTPVKIVYKLAEPIIEEIDQALFYEILAHDGATNISIPMSDNLLPENVFRFPRSEDGALVTTDFANGKKNEIKMSELETKLATVMLNLE